MKKYIKLLIKCICVILPMIVLCSFFRTHLLSFIDSEGPYYIWNREFTNTSHDKQYNIIIIGDSSANAAYIPEYLSDDTINLALGGLSTVENYYTLKDWLDHNAPPKVCYISFYDSLLSLDGYFWTRAYYAHRYSLSENIEMLKTAFQYNEKTILRDHPILDLISYELYLPNKYITPFLNASFNQRYDSNISAIKSDDLHGGRYIARGTYEYNPKASDNYATLTVNPMFDYYYRKMIDLCYDYGVTVRIVKLPLPDSTVFGPDYEESFYTYYDVLQENYPGLTVDWFPLYPRDLFADNRHANAHGALRFSSELKELYPDDFVNDTLSDRRIEAINDSISIENRLPQVLQWIKDKDYTVVIYDGSNKFKEYYETDVINMPEIGGLSLKTLNVDAQGVWEAYFISGMNTEEQSIVLTLTENGMNIQTADSAALSWNISMDDKVWISVIDNYNDKIIFSKAFRFVESTFEAA